MVIWILLSFWVYFLIVVCATVYMQLNGAGGGSKKVSDVKHSIQFLPTVRSSRLTHNSLPLFTQFSSANLCGN